MTRNIYYSIKNNLFSNRFVKCGILFRTNLYYFRAVITYFANNRKTKKHHFLQIIEFEDYVVNFFQWKSYLKYDQ